MEPSWGALFKLEGDGKKKNISCKLDLELQCGTEGVLYEVTGWAEVLAHCQIYPKPCEDVQIIIIK